MKTIQFALSADLDQEIGRVLTTLPDCIPAFAATLRHETGHEAFLLGFDQASRVRELLYDNRGRVFAMLMTAEQAQKFDGKTVSLHAGYISIAS